MDSFLSWFLDDVRSMGVVLAACGLPACLPSPRGASKALLRVMVAMADKL